MRLIARLLVGLLALSPLLGAVAQANGGFGPGPGIGSFAGGSGVTAGVKVGSGGVLVRTDTGATVNLIIQGVSGAEHGPLASSGNAWSSISTVTSAQWAAGIQYWTNTLTTPGKPYGTVNTIRLFLSSVDWEAACGIDPYNQTGSGGSGPSSASAYYYSVGTDTNGRTIYCAGSGGGVGTVGHEVYGDPTAYRTFVTTTVANILGASSTLGYPMYVILNPAWTGAAWNHTNQILMPLDQSAMPAPLDLLMLHDLAVLYGNNYSVLMEMYNEPIGTWTGANNTTEASWLSNANGGVTAGGGQNVSFAFPTTTTSPYTPVGASICSGLSGASQRAYSMGTNIGCPPAMPSGSISNAGDQTAIAISEQQELNTYRADGGHNVALQNTLNASALPESMPQNGGTFTVTDPYTIGGVQQLAMAFHAYSAHSLSYFTAVFNAGIPIIEDEAGRFISNAPSGYTYWYSNHWSYGWCCWASFNGPTSIYPNDGNPFGSNFSILGESPWVNGNTASSSSDTTQIPTGSNFRLAPPVVRLHGHAANDDYFDRLMTGTRMY